MSFSEASSSSGQTLEHGGQLHLHRRLLNDIAELCEKPYPNIELRVDEADLSRACLILSPDEYPLPLHLTVIFGRNYPVSPPEVRIETRITHPNIYGSYICASILNTTEGYTPAYTLKGIAIQLLSFFGSDRLEQDTGGYKDLRNYRGAYHLDNFRCTKCGFGQHLSHAVRLGDYMPMDLDKPTRRAAAATKAVDVFRCYIKQMPDELVLQLLEELDFEELTALARAWDRVGRLITGYNVLRQRELLCFCLKTSFRECKLGIGVASPARARVESEFDLISETAFRTLEVRSSVHGIGFRHWLPLPISRRHWQRVRGDLDGALGAIAAAAHITGAPSQVLFAFMNHIVVRLNQDLSNQSGAPSARNGGYHSAKSTLRHASEKAIESYFHIFHLLVCMAAEQPAIVRDANRLIDSFVAGRTSKTDCPNLGFLLVALLISDREVTVALMKAIITEAVTRNVVWMLDAKGAGMADLAFLEPDDEVSAYRLQKTFEASRTSYRLLMFSELFRRTARPAADGAAPRKPLAELRDELFDRHGGPPPGTANRLAGEVRRLQTINNFPDFLREMGVPVPGALGFSQLLRRTVRESMAKGYSRWGLSSVEAKLLRLKKEQGVELPGLQDHRQRLVTKDAVVKRINSGLVSFFPERESGGRANGGRANGRRRPH